MENFQPSLCYCISRKLRFHEENFLKVLKVLFLSIETNSKYYDLTLYTDEATFKYVQNYPVKIKVVNYLNLRFIDDIKIQTLPHLKKEDILIDIDIFIFSKLEFTPNCDLLLETKYTLPLYYKREYKEASKFEFSKFISFPTTSGKVGNIGVIKFFNRELENKYIEKYNFISSLAYEEIKNVYSYRKFSGLMGEIILQNLIDMSKVKVEYLKDKNNTSYLHLAGPRKYNEKYLTGIIKKNNLI